MHRRAAIFVAGGIALGCAGAPVAEAPPAPPPIRDAGDVALAIDRGDRRALELALASGEASVRAAALRGIGPDLLPDDARPLAAAVRDLDPAVRREAALAIGRIGLRPEALGPEDHLALVDAVSDALAVESDPEIRRALVFAHGRIGGVAGPLLVVLANDARLREEALYALGMGLQAPLRERPGDPAERAAIGSAAAAHVRDSDPEVRAAVAWLFARLADPAVEEWLAALARDEDTQVRAFAAQGLGAVAMRPSLLEALLGDPEPLVRVEAAHGLLEGLARARTAGVRGLADLAMEEAFAQAIDRSVEALAIQLRRGAVRTALHPLLALAEGASSRARARARQALQGLGGEVRTTAASNERGATAGADLLLPTPQGTVAIALDAQAAPLAVARLAEAVRAGAFGNARVASPRIGRWLEIAPAQPLGGNHLPGENGGMPWRRGTVGLRADGTLIFALGRLPELEGRISPIGKVIAGIEELERLRPGDAIGDPVMH